LDDLTSFGHVIGVNDAALHTSVHECLTMDRLWFEHRWPLLRDTRIASIWVREKCDCNVMRKDGRDRWQTFKHFSKSVPSETVGELHGGNSGACAINLAYQQMLAGDNLFLLGFDMQKGPKGEPYWYPPYPWTTPAGATKDGHFVRWVDELRVFATNALAKGFNVYNVTTRSRLVSFPRITYEQMMEMLNG
jgi:hypothetical protein